MLKVIENEFKQYEEHYNELNERTAHKPKSGTMTIKGFCTKVNPAKAAKDPNGKAPPRSFKIVVISRSPMTIEHLNTDQIKRYNKQLKEQGENEEIRRLLTEAKKTVMHTTVINNNDEIFCKTFGGLPERLSDPKGWHSTTEMVEVTLLGVEGTYATLDGGKVLQGLQCETVVLAKSDPTTGWLFRLEKKVPFTNLPIRYPKETDEYPDNFMVFCKTFANTDGNVSLQLYKGTEDEARFSYKPKDKGEKPIYPATLLQRAGGADYMLRTTVFDTGLQELIYGLPLSTAADIVLYQQVASTNPIPFFGMVSAKLDETREINSPKNDIPHPITVIGYVNTAVFMLRWYLLSCCPPVSWEWVKKYFFPNKASIPDEMTLIQKRPSPLNALTVDVENDRALQNEKVVLLNHYSGLLQDFHAQGCVFRVMHAQQKDEQDRMEQGAMSIEDGEAFLAKIQAAKLVYATLPWTEEEQASLNRILNPAPAPKEEGGEEESVQKRHRVDEGSDDEENLQNSD